ncbi:hypothetical protein RB195_011844 [Necator americanus]|uniref:Reverse transcriptase domain-containing protein n=1 Tax=Necator americanus TaxID=51031 RepID=A0ABR1D5Y4_NECAM
MQGDTLNPLLFCLAIAPVSYWIQRHTMPYTTKTRNRTNGALQVEHILYMDDLKIYSPNKDDMTLARRGIQDMFGSLGLELNTRKCASRSLNCASSGQVQLDNIPILGGAKELHKYLGAEQNSLVRVGELFDRVVSAAMETAKRLQRPDGSPESQVQKELFSSDLTVRQKVNGFNQIVIPKLKYAISCVIFGAGKLSTLKKRANRFDAKVRKVIEESHLRFRSNCAARLYVDKESGGLGLKSVENELEISIAYSWCYLATSTDLLVSYELAEWFHASNKRSIISDFQKVLVTNGLERRVSRAILTSRRGQQNVLQRNWGRASDLCADPNQVGSAPITGLKKQRSS